LRQERLYVVHLAWLKKPPDGDTVGFAFTVDVIIE
jgi:hypothetical protein